MGGSAPPPPDYNSERQKVAEAGQAQMANNRLSTYSPFSSQTFNADGSTSTQFSGGLGAANAGLMGQVGGLSQPMDWAALGKMPTGDGARQQAIAMASKQMGGVMDPAWAKREEAAKARLLSQGLDPSSPEFQRAMSALGGQRADAYSSAQNMAIGHGTAGGDALFRRDALMHQQRVADAIRQRQMPLEEMQRMQAFLAQPDYAKDTSTLHAAISSSSLENNAQAEERRIAEKNAWEAEQLRLRGGVPGSGALRVVGQDKRVVTDDFGQRARQWNQQKNDLFPGYDDGFARNGGFD